MAFNLRSGNTSAFKSMGSSPMKEIDEIPAQEDAADKTNLEMKTDGRAIPADQFRHMARVERQIRENFEDGMKTTNFEDGMKTTVDPDHLPPDFIGPLNSTHVDGFEDDHFAKGEDYIVDSGEGEMTRDRDGKWEHKDDGKYKPEFNKNKLEYIEEQVDDYLDNPMDKGAEKAWEIAGETNRANTQIPFSEPEEHANADPLRHTLAAMYTSEKVGMIPTNVMGIMHELTAKNTAKEHREDILNNLIGSVIGSVPFTSTEKKEKLVQKLWEKGLLFSGTPPELEDNEFMKKRKVEMEQEEDNMNINAAIEETKNFSDGL
tara:strand:- start:506 stop:1459 length:954 start_codon:yes stop_codon:yes gene_type:complete